MIKVVSLFLIGMLALALFGRLRVPNSLRRVAGKCPSCGRPRIGRGTCPCGHKGGQ